MSRLRSPHMNVPLMCWLVLVWVMLWGTVNPGTVLLGVAAGVVVVAVCPLPRTPPGCTVRPVQLLLLVGYLIYELSSSAVDVAWQAIRYGPRVRAAIVEVPLQSGHDRIIAVAANLMSMAPGEFVIQVDRDEQLLFVHVLGARTPEQAERARAGLVRLQTQVVRTFSPRAVSSGSAPDGGGELRKEGE